MVFLLFLTKLTFSVSYQFFFPCLAVHCPVLPPRRSLTISSQATKMNSLIKFTCGNGNALIGASEITCLPSGNWSAPLPVCESMILNQVNQLKSSFYLMPSQNHSKLFIFILFSALIGRQFLEKSLKIWKNQ